MDAKSQFRSKAALIAVVAVSVMPSLGEAALMVWGQLHGFSGRALRDGLDFWAGGFLALHGHVPVLFDPVAYQSFIHGLYGKLPTHMWSYPPNYLLIATGFGGLSPWHAVLSFDLASLLLLIIVLRAARVNGWIIAALVFSPVSIENFLEGQNAALMTALIGGGLLLLPLRPRWGGVLVGLASIKPQLGIALPLYLLRKSPLACAWAVLAAVALGAASLWAFGPSAWILFWHVTRPAMSNVLLTGKPPEFAGGLISVFATFRFLGVHPALAVQGVVSVAAVLLAWRARDAVVVLVLVAIASPYLHTYDLMGVALAVALLVRDRLARGFAPGEPVLFFVAWFGPGALPWIPQYAHATPLVLLLLLASAAARGRTWPCDSLPAPPGSPASSAGRSPIPDLQDSTARG